MVQSLLVAALIFMAAPMDVGVASSQQPTIQGAWNARVYRLASGQVHTVRGHIFFADAEWQVLFFVMDNDEPRRGSGEGGTYTLRGDQLTFEHHYLLAAGDEMSGLPATSLRMEARDGTGPSEPTRVELTDEQLILHFPSGNSLEFTRSSP
jgi:hypothetical protein